ncbi:cytoplasmic protein [Russula earlei]|uniref:Cytoplasmic protein n=1 Tax=Russula earlei TaxID=71964 RepID=A0ACC0TSD9_9AGAM|nr:cytoplasmic protein [Russula earlei]
MVLFFTSTAHEPPVTIYMGRDKVENEDLIKYAWPQDVWFHVDKLSSAHVYLRLPESISSWEAIPEPLLLDCAQLVKANSIEGNKRNDLTIIYTPADNLKKTGDMAVGQVSFHNDKGVKRVHIPKRENTIVNRLNKTKVERVVDHEAERIERAKHENAVKRAAAAAKVWSHRPTKTHYLNQVSNWQKKADLELAEARKAEKAARSYDSFLNSEVDDEEEATKPKYSSVREMEEDFM